MKLSKNLNAKSASWQATDIAETTNDAMFLTERQIQDRLEYFFDREYYLNSNPDVLEGNIDPLNHYIKFGWKEGRLPNAWYSDELVSHQIREANTSVPAFVLFLSMNDEVSFRRYADLAWQRNSRASGHQDCWSCDAMRQHFNAQYYRKIYPDVPESIDPLAHFCEQGWKEQRRPSALFDTRYYLSANPDVYAAEINPFVHYLTAGIVEGRKPKPLDPPKRNLLKRLETFSTISNKYKNIKPEISPLESEALFLTLYEAIKDGKSLTLSLSHDNYLKHTGGIQKFIKDESGWAQNAGSNYLHLCPTIPNINFVSSTFPLTFLLNVNFNNNFVGTFTAKEIVDNLKSIGAKFKGSLSNTIVHSIMGWNPESLIAIAETPFSNRYFYVHDYSSFCIEYRLLRNGATPCDAPPVNSHDCNVCVHGCDRRAHVDQYTDFFSVYKPTLIFPSAKAQEMHRASKLHQDLSQLVLPHLSISQNAESAQPPLPLPLDKPSSKKIRIAFCGAPAAHKGFFHFSELVDQCNDRENLEFFHFGIEPGELNGVNFVKVDLNNGESRMTEELREKNIDLVFIGSTWRETFNFVTYEALAAGAAILSLETAGNPADIVRIFQVGHIAKSVDDVVFTLSRPDLRTLIKTWKANLLSLRFTANKSIFTEEHA